MPARGVLSASVEIPPALEHLDERVARAEQLLLEYAAEDGARELAKQAPGGPGGAIGRTAHPKIVSSSESQSVVTHPGAGALDKGAFITPRGLKGKSMAELRRQKKRLKFTVDGKVVFAPFVRLKPRRFVRKAERARGRIIRDAAQRAFEREGLLR